MVHFFIFIFIHYSLFIIHYSLFIELKKIDCYILYFTKIKIFLK